MNLIFASLVILFIHFLNLFYTVLPTNDVDRVALLAIKSEISEDPRGVLSSCNNSLPHCQWSGVTCGVKHPQRVVELHLGNKGLVGTLSPYVGNLSFLHYLLLSNNTFRGYIPPQIGHLLRLRSLVLERNSFEGEIPGNISRCLRLRAISLANNNLTGVIPPHFGLLTNLELLFIQQNQLTGDLLNTVVINMTSLQALSAANNSFQGSIPDNIGVLQNLTCIALAQNMISGNIPPSLYNLSSLQVFDLDLNRLQGTLPLDIGFSLPQLTAFKISGNSFHGHLPISLSNLTHLEQLAIYSNNFTGKFMFSARNMPGLWRLDITDNYLGAREADDLSFLQTLANCSQLQLLGCANNNFGGVLPHYLGNLSSSLTEVSFGRNQIIGSIPTGLFNLINLKRLDLEHNHLSGNLPPQIGKLRNLEAFYCDNNHLIGKIPFSLGNLSRLSQLYLDKNSFKGIIPSSLGELGNLLYLSLSQNNLSGFVPPQLFDATSMLVELHLDHNNLQGIIPMEIEQLKNLVWLDLSENGFYGELPIGLSSCIGLIELDMGGNFFSGSIPKSFKSLASMSTMNLSHNKLSGPIPSFLANFSLMKLDLSFNNFEGEIPKEGVFANTSAFSILGNNKLCGGIPELHLPTCLVYATPKRKKGKLSVFVIVIIAVASLVVGVSILSLVFFLLGSRRKQNKTSGGSELSLVEHFSKVSYDMLLKATNRFSKANLLGVGRFGSVYKGVLDQESNMVVAVKVISLEQRGATKSFMAECKALRSIRHRNLLKIVTICSSTDFQGNDFKALVYKFMTNGSLHQWIHTDPNLRALSLLRRVDIAIDVASALNYLHNDCDEPIIHCDLKPSNILLDNDMVAHVGDFGLARFHLRASANNSSSVAVKGTVGYAAPEYGVGSMVSKEGDVYSYGIVLLELMTSKNPTDRMFKGGLDLHTYAKSVALLPNQLINIIDPRLLDDGTDNASEGNDGELLAENERKMKCIRSVVEIGVKCSVESPQDRMKIEDAIGELQVTRDVLLKELHIIRASLQGTLGMLPVKQGI